MVEKIDKDLLRGLAPGQSVKCKMPFNKILSARNIVSQLKRETGWNFTTAEVEPNVLEVTRIS